MKTILKATGKVIMKALPILAGVSLLLGVTYAGDYPTISSISTNMQTTIGYVASIITNVALVVGIALICASFFKMKQHKDQPTQVPISNGVTLLVIGAALTIFPLLLPTANQAAFGSGVDTGTVTSGAMTSLIGATT
ncbi:MAG: type IV secretion protein IcmD [Coxiellaceae bacterium]|mgnify:CR=1 FL=1|nr:type IV secretion protein IcmD [Coxiellaceae bacterium]|tara:strand:+ start:2984 stop:3394 length:411 start_codon:yes stop_codon:yes gene_type:complete